MCDTVALDSVLTRYARSLIRFKARQLIRRPGFSRADQEDLEQDLWAAVLTQAANFDPERASLNTFINRVVNTTVAIILRERRRLKRAEGLRARSLDDPSSRDERGNVPAATLCESDDRRRSHDRSHDTSCRPDIADAVQQALQQMPAHLQDICRRVMGASPTSVARDMDTSRRQLRKALNEAKSYFQDAGFEDC